MGHDPPKEFAPHPNPLSRSRIYPTSAKSLGDRTRVNPSSVASGEREPTEPADSADSISPKLGLVPGGQSVHPGSKAVPPLELGLLLLLGILWGIPYALTKIALETIPPITLTAARVSLAAVALWIVAILNSTTPIFVCLIGVTWTRHEPITIGRLSGALIGLGGVVVIAGASALLGLGRETAGQAAILLATFSSAISVIHGRRFADMDPEVVAAGMLTCAAIVLVPMCLLVEAPWRAAPSAASLTALSANAVVATAFGFVIYFRLIRTIGSMGTASTGYLKPAVGVLIGCALLGEPLTWTLAVGLLAILFGVAAINGSASLLSDAIKRGKDRLRRRAGPLAVARNGTERR